MGDILGELDMKGKYNLECWRVNPADGQRYKVWCEECPNQIMNQGLDYLNNVFFFTNAKQTWLFALVASNTAPTPTLTYATPTYTESTGYTTSGGAGIRPAATFVVSSGQSTNTAAAPANFTWTNATETLYGAALVCGANANTAGNTGTANGVLYSYGRFAANRAVVATDIVLLTYTATAISNS